MLLKDVPEVIDNNFLSAVRQYAIKSGHLEEDKSLAGQASGSKKRKRREQFNKNLGR